jgi:hypothetical protein
MVELCRGKGEREEAGSSAALRNDSQKGKCNGGLCPHIARQTQIPDGNDNQKSETQIPDGNDNQKSETQIPCGNDKPKGN